MKTKITKSSRIYICRKSEVLSVILTIVLLNHSLLDDNSSTFAV